MRVGAVRCVVAVGEKNSREQLAANRSAAQVEQAERSGASPGTPDRPFTNGRLGGPDGQRRFVRSCARPQALCGGTPRQRTVGANPPFSVSPSGFPVGGPRGVLIGGEPCTNRGNVLVFLRQNTELSLSQGRHFGGGPSRVRGDTPTGHRHDRQSGHHTNGGGAITADGGSTSGGADTSSTMYTPGTPGSPLHMAPVLGPLERHVQHSGQIHIILPVTDQHRL